MAGDRTPTRPWKNAVEEAIVRAIESEAVERSMTWINGPPDRKTPCGCDEEPGRVEQAFDGGGRFPNWLTGSGPGSSTATKPSD